MSDWCKGSMRKPKRAVVVSGTPWGLCVRCEAVQPLALRGLTKPHRAP